MKTVWKYEINLYRQSFSLPKDSKILTVQTQNNIPCIWVLVDTEQKEEERRYEIYGTGHRIDPTLNLEYIGTFQVDGGTLVFHLFEVKE